MSEDLSNEPKAQTSTLTLEQEIVTLYRQGIGTPTIYNRLKPRVNSISAVLKILREAGVERKKSYNQQGQSGQRVLTKEDDKRIAELYLAGKSSPEIFELFKHRIKQSKSILDSLKRSKIEPKEKWQYTKMNHSYFNKIDNEAKAYFLGWMITDGWVQKDSNEVGLQLQFQDKHILELFKKELEIENPILLTENMWRVVAHSPILKKDLDKYGVVPQKTFLSFFPHLSTHLMPHLIRGLIDGDGCVHITPENSLHIYLCGTFQLCSGLRQYLADTLGVSLPKITPMTSIYTVTWTERSDVEKLKQYIWSNYETSYTLFRKRDLVKNHEN